MEEGKVINVIAILLILFCALSLVYKLKNIIKS